VNIYAVGKEARKRFTGNHDNTEIAEFIRDYLALDLGCVTERLNLLGQRVD
jgi:alkaline phosphatase